MCSIRLQHQNSKEMAEVKLACEVSVSSQEPLNEHLNVSNTALSIGDAK